MSMSTQTLKCKGYETFPYTKFVYGNVQTEHTHSEEILRRGAKS